MPSSNGVVNEAKVPLLEDQYSSKEDGIVQLSGRDDDQELGLGRRVWIESKKLWHIVGPAIFSRIASYSMLVITQAFAGHLGDLELAAISISNNVIVGFDFGLLVNNPFYLFCSVPEKWKIIDIICQAFIAEKIVPRFVTNKCTPFFQSKREKTQMFYIYHFLAHVFLLLITFLCTLISKSFFFPHKRY